jgi:hypothetical protein
LGPISDALDLWDYRRRVDDIYHKVRQGGAGEETWSAWVRDRDRLFATHPQSPIEDRSLFTGLPYFPYDRAWRVNARFTAVDDEAAILDHSGDGTTRFSKIGVVEFELIGNPASLEVLWLDAYGGGVFLPFRDASNGVSTYGGGRYLLDTAKGADLGHDGDSIVLDFNYAYHPSCVHSYQWSCPLAPPANTLGFAVEAGETLTPT